jgi:hypothetical protein
MANFVQNLTSGQTKQAQQNQPKPAAPYNFGNAVQSLLGFDPTPGFNITRSVGGGIPFVERTTPSRKDATAVGSPVPQASPAGGSSGQQDQGGYGGASDPYAAWGGQAAYDNLTSGFNTQKQNIYGTARESAQGAARGYQGSILDYLDSLRSGQQAIDEHGVQNELARKQGTTSILDMVGRGIRQGGTMLAGKNATDSSAAEGIARAYGDIGRRQLSGVGNQYELANRDLGLEQSSFDTQRAAGARHLDENKVQAVNGIVTDARNRLASLDAAMADANVPTRIQLEQEKEAIKQETLGILSQYDQQLAQGSAGVNPTSTEDRRRTAADLATRGVAASNPFDFTAQAPAQFQNTGPFASELPLFSLRPRRQEG